MRTVAQLVAIVVVSSTSVASQADNATAAPVKECGNAGTLYDGAVRVYNVTTRVVRCRTARRFARRYILFGGPACGEDRYCTYRGWSCRNVQAPSGRGPIDSRCTKDGGRVIRFQYAEA